MKAIGFSQPLAITEPSSLLDIELPQPVATGRDLLVKVAAIAVNPVDFKIRQNATPEAGEHRVLGWDAVGEVVATGDQVTDYNVGDKVYYAGDLTRQGSNAEFQLVDERIVGKKPKTLSDIEAAALPLTSITAWELLFEHLNVIHKDSVDQTLNPQETQETLLIVGASGGVGSILIQLAKSLTNATVIGTASRKQSQQWVKSLGADYVIDHSQPLQPQVQALGIDNVTHVASLTHTDSYFEQYIELLAPFGKIGMIDDPSSLDVMKMKPKSLSLHIEFMFARSMFKAKDMDAQRNLLNLVADLVDSGHLKTTFGKHLGNINAENLKQAHAELESGKSIGKIVLSGF